MELELESPAVHAILEEVRRIYDLEEDNRCESAFWVKLIRRAKL